MIGWLKLAIIFGALIATGSLLWISVAPQMRSVSWYVANPTELAADFAWCREHPGGGVLHLVGPDCNTVVAAKMRADTAAFLAAMPK